ncbi:MAG: hypothetical protein IT450_00545 [Phycisphaerales bacterium]|nr:hypothetical protein [Phycisphaerales bacterium]
MNSQTCLRAILIGAALLASAATAAGQDAAPERVVSVLMRVSRGDGDMPMSGDWFQRILASEGVLGLASRQVLKRDPEPGEIQLHFIEAPEPGGKGEGSRNPNQIFGTVTLISRSEKVSVEQLRDIAKHLGTQLQVVVERLTGSERERMTKEIDRFAKRREMALQEIESREAERRELLRGAGAEFSTRGDAVRRLAEELQSQKNALDLQLTGQQARTEALTRRIAELAAAIKQAADSDVVAAELTRVLEGREAELAMEQKRVEAGQSSREMLMERMSQVALARVEVLRARSAAGAGLQEQLARMNGDLVTLSVDAAEAEARRAYVESKLAELRKSDLLDRADRADRLSDELVRLREDLTNAERGLRAAREAIDRYSGPSVELIGLDEPATAR